ncbi:MAG: carboxypeptidase-like regulatory domain-containing protein [Marinifilaceae bacterium]
MKFKRKLTYQHFKRYFGNNLPNKEEHAFEKEMMQDAFESDAYDGLSQLSSDELARDMAELQKGIRHKTKSEKRLVPTWFAYAASVLLLIGIGASIFFANRYFTPKNIVEEQIAQDTRQEEATPKKEKQEPSVVKRDSQSRQTTPPPVAKAKLKAVPIALDEVKEQPIADQKETAIPTEQKKIQPKRPILESTRKEVVQPTSKKSHKLAKLAAIEKKSEDDQPPIQEAQQGQVAGMDTNTRMKSTNRTRAFVSNAKNIPLIKISGRVVSPDNEPIPGSSIIIQGTKIGTTTNLDGKFTLEVPSDEKFKTLTASFIGFKQKNIPIDSNNNLLILLEEEQLAMNEVVVTGFSKRGKTAEIVKAQPIHNSIRKYKKELLKNLDYSKLSEFQGTHRIKFSFSVETNGSFSNFQFEQSPNSLFEQEIVRTMKTSEKWQPQMMDGEPNQSRVELSLRIHIK